MKEQLKKAYEAVEMLKALELPVSYEQKREIEKLEKEYLKEEVIPLWKQEMQPLVEIIKGKFEMEVTFEKGNGLNIIVVNSAKKKYTDPFEINEKKNRKKNLSTCLSNIVATANDSDNKFHKEISFILNEYCKIKGCAPTKNGIYHSKCIKEIAEGIGYTDQIITRTRKDGSTYDIVREKNATELTILNFMKKSLLQSLCEKKNETEKDSPIYVEDIESLIKKVEETNIFD